MTAPALRAPRFSVVIPVHNEADCLEAEVRSLVRELDAHGLDFEMVLSENGSTDTTAALADALAMREPRLRVLHLPVPDYGEAMRRGMACARGELVVNFDIDYHDLDFVVAAAALTDRFGIVVGSKIMGGSQDRRSPFRRLVSRVFTLVLRVLFDPRVDDTHGMKVFRREVVEAYLPGVVMGKDLFDTELVLRARRGGVAVGAIPVVVEEKRKARSSIVRRIPRTIKGLLALRLIFWKEQLRGARDQRDVHRG
ncbi:MAG: glycosyltransferase family 2 protein [Actinobacteria bacterium]|nr:glycosyltransferase family 2 protein [Actinomycetota bacterium]